MSYLRTCIWRLAGLFDKERKDRELSEELESHLQMHIEDSVRSGMSTDEARRQALIQLGGLEQTKERYRDRRGFLWLESVLQDVRFGARMLRKSPGFTGVAVLTLALGIGANTAVFSVIDAVLLHPLPFANADRLVWAWGNYVHAPRAAVSPPDFLDYRAQGRSFASLGAYNLGDPENLIIDGRPQQVSGAMVSSGFLETLGARPLLGRTFQASDEQVQRPESIVVSYRFWQQRLGAVPDVLGRRINFTDRSATLIGVMPREFEYPPQAEFWFPIPMLSTRLQQREAHFLTPIGLLKPGMSLAQAQSDMDAIAARLARQYPSSNEGWGVRLEPMQEAIVGPVRGPLLLLFGAVVLVLLIACVNVASLLLARNSTRQKEMAIRAALGAGTGRIATQLVTESVMLGLTGGAAGLLLAAWGMYLLRSFGPAEIPRLDAAQLNGTVLAFATAVSIGTGILFGLAPALQARKTDVQTSLKEGGRSSETQNRQRLRRVLVVAEVTFSAALLIGAGLLLNSLWRLVRVDPGFDPRGVLTTQLVLPYQDENRRFSFVREFLGKLNALPGVEAAGATSELSLDGQANQTYFTAAARPPAVPQDAQIAHLRIISGDFFQAMRIPMLGGRAFSQRDRQDSPRVMLVDESFVRRYFPKESPVGKRLLVFTGEFVSAQVIGVVGGIRHSSLQNPPEPTIYLPYSQFPNFGLGIVVRSAANLAPPTAGIRAALSSLDANQSLSGFRTMDEIVFTSVARHRFNTVLLGLFGSIALVLAAAGVYGLVSYTVVRKTQEIGIRLALGAAPGAALRLILLQGMKLVAIGAVLGVALAAWLTRWMASQLYGVRAIDPATFAIAIAVLGLVALLACYIPARRATKVDPMVALRYE